MITDRLRNKHCIITGAGSGLGRETALRLHACGAHLALLGRRKSALDETKQFCIEKDASRVPCVIVADLSSWKNAAEAVALAVSHFGEVIDILVANAGRSMYAPIEECEELVFKGMLEANYLTTITVIQHALPYLCHSNGCVAAVTSIQAVVGVPYHCAYVAAKHAVSGYLETLEMECPGLSVVEFLPGWIRGTGLREMAMDGKGNREKRRSHHKRHSRGSVSVQECAMSLVKAIAKKKRRTFLPRLWRHVPLAKIVLRPFLFRKINALQSYGTDARL